MEQNGLEPRKRERHVGGVRLVGIFVPWQAVALTLAVVVALTAVAAVRWSGDGQAKVHLTAADEATTTTTTIESTSTTTGPTTTTVPAPTTTSPARAVTPSTAAPTTTTTTVPVPATCAVIKSAVSGSVSSSWVASPTRPSTWDRHMTVTVKNPMDQPVTLGYVAGMSRATSYVFQTPEADGRRLAPGESLTVEDIFNYAGDPTVRGYSPPPDQLYSVEFTPVSAPDLFCRIDLDHPGATQGTKPHPTEPMIYPSSSEMVSNAVPVSFSTQGLFTGVRVHYRMLMKGGNLQEFTADLSKDFQGVSTAAKATYPLADVMDYGSNSSSGHPPWFQGVTSVEWNGTVKPCSQSISYACAPADGSLLQRLPS